MIKINQKLLSLRVVLFFFSGASAAVSPYVAVFLKQRGLSIGQIAIIYIISPIFQFLGPVIAGITADKLGRSKPVLVANIILLTSVLNCMLLLPKVPVCEPSKCICGNNDAIARNHSFYNFLNSSKCDSQCVDPTNYNSSISWDVIYQDIKHYTNLSNETLNGDRICVPSTDISTKHLDECWYFRLPDCNFTCRPDQTVKPQTKCGNSMYLFIYSAMLLILYAMFKSACFRFTDITSMVMVETYGSHFGHERVWNSVGSIVFYIISGSLFTFTEKKSKTKDYSPAFYLFDVVIVLTMIPLWFLDVKMKPRAKRMWRQGFMLLQNVEVLIFILAVFVIGTSYSIAGSFTLLYLDSLGAPAVLFGLNPAMKNLFALPFMMKSKVIIGKIGSIHMPLLSMISYVIFFLAFSFLENPWISLVIQSTGIFSYFLLWVAVIVRCHDLAPVDLTATVISMAGSMHHAVGKGVGSALGGFTMDVYGGKVAFRLMAAFAGTGAILYSIYLLVRLRFATSQYSDTACNSTKPEKEMYNLEYQLKNESSTINTPQNYSSI